MMRSRQHAVTLVALAVACVCVLPLRAQLSATTATARAENAKILLFETTRVTLAVEGSAPLRVELPAKLLAKDTDHAWRIRPVSPATVTALPNNRERWEQVYRLSPVALGELVVRFSPAKVNGEELEWPTVTVTVNKTLENTNATALPVTTIEEIATLPPTQRRSQLWWVAGIVACACAVVAGVVFTRKRTAPPVPPAEWAFAEFAQLRATDNDNTQFAERLAAIVRAFVERSYAIPATKLTTGELAEATRTANWPDTRANALRELLDECDLAKFAKTAITRDRCETLLATARVIVAGE